MAQFCIEIADNDIIRVLNAVAANYNRPEFIENPYFDYNQPENENENPKLIINPEPKSVFANKIVRQFLSENVKAFEVKEAKRLAEEQVALNASVSINDPYLI